MNPSDCHFFFTFSTLNPLSIQKHAQTEFSFRVFSYVKLYLTYNILNLQVFEEIINELNKRSEEQNLGENYGEDIYNFVVKGLDDVLNKMN